MTDQVSIPPSSQGSPAASGTTAKAQAGGKGSGFLGMLMAAIGSKPADGMGAASSSAAHALETNTKTKKGEGKGLSLIDAAAKAIADKAAAESGKQHAIAKTQGKSTTATLLIDATSKSKAGIDKGLAAATASAKSDTAASLIDATAKAIADGKSASAAHLAMADKASTASSTDQGAANKHAGRKARSKEKPSSPTTVSIAAAMQPVTIPVQTKVSSSHQDTGVSSQEASQHGGSKSANNTALNAAAVQTTLSSHGKVNVADASMPISTKDGAADQAAIQTAQASAKDVQTKAGQTDARTLPTGAGKPKAMPAPGQAGTAVTEALLADASGQPATDAHIQDRQGSARGTGKSASASGNAQTTAAATQQAKNETMINGIADAHGNTKVQANASTHADAHPGASHPSDAQQAQASAATASKPGIHSYARVAAHTLAQATPTTPLTHQPLPAAADAHQAAMAQAPAPGQDLAMGTAQLTAAPGLGQSTQAMSTPQMTAPQAPVHASGPWTTMAAMTEIGQAAATGLTRLELKLEPAHLGKVHVRIDSDHRKNIQVHLVVEQPNARQAIEQQLPNLRHALEQQGLNLGNFSMSSQQQGGGQGSGQQGQQPAMASVPSFNAPQAQAPQITNTPSDLPVNGRLSIRV